MLSRSRAIAEATALVVGALLALSCGTDNSHTSKDHGSVDAGGWTARDGATVSALDASRSGDGGSTGATSEARPPDAGPPDAALPDVGQPNGAGGSPLSDASFESGEADSGKAESSDASDIAEAALGHLVLIGNTYSSYDAQDERLLGNAAFLGGGTGTVRILEYVEFLEDPFVSWDVSPMVHEILVGHGATVGRSVTFAPLADHRELERALDGTDVFLIYDQLCARGSCGTGTGELPAIAAAWNPLLNEFLEDGGVIVALSGRQSQTSWAQTYLLVTGPGLLDISQFGADLGVAEIAAPGGPLTVGVPSSWTPTHRYLTFPAALGGTGVVRDHSTLNPIVLHLERPPRCATSLDCLTRTASTCHTGIGECVECQTGLQCADNEYCSSGTCREPGACTTSLNCQSEPDGKTLCNPATGACVECLADADCAPGRSCAVGNVCVTACSGNGDCTASDVARVCDAGVGVCVQCLDDAQCAVSQYCELGECVEDTCVPNTQVCSGNAVYECNETGSAMELVNACNVAACADDGGTAACENLPDAGSRCPLSCQSCTLGVSCCTPEFTCGCSTGSNCIAL